MSKQKDEEYHRILSTIEFRQLNQVEKAVMLVNMYNVSERKAAELCNISCAAVGCGKEALKKGRLIGVVGRPQLLGDDSLEELKLWIEQQASKGSPVTYLQFQDKVCIHDITQRSYSHTQGHRHLEEHSWT